MTISLQDLCTSAEQSNTNDLPLPGFTHYVYGPTNSLKYMYILKRGLPFTLTGQGQWTFTLSIASKDLERAWQIIAPRLFEEEKGIASCEVYNLNYNAANDKFRNETDGITDEVGHESQKKVRDGAQIIIHSAPNHQQAQDLLELLTDVETLLTKASIQAGGAKPRANIRVDGSSYFHTRNQLNGGFRISIPKSIRLAKESGRPAYNVTGAANPFAYFNLGRSRHPTMHARKCSKNNGASGSVVSSLKEQSDIKAILFDTFGTVVDWRGTMVKEFRLLFEEKEITRVDCERFIDVLVNFYAEKMGEISEHKIPFATVDDLNKIALDNTLKSYNIYEKFTEEERNNMWMVWHRLDAWPDSVIGLNELKKNFIIGTLSNGNVSLLIDLSKRAKLKWDVILSGELWSCYKPNPLVYQNAAKMLNLDPSEILLVASHKYDLKAARECGFKTAYIFRPSEFETLREDQSPRENEFDFVTTEISKLPAMLNIDDVSSLTNSFRR